jgi:hypothetical protein
MFSRVESQVIVLSKEIPIVSVGLRNNEVLYTNQNKNGLKNEGQMLGQPLHICVDFPMRKGVILTS